MKTLLAIIGLCVSLSAQAANYFVDIGVTGSSSNAGTSEANAWTNIASINWTTIGSGDTVWINGGNYYESLNIGPETGISIKISSNAVSQAVFTWGQYYNCDNSVLDGYLNASNPYMFAFTTNLAAITGGFAVRGGVTNTTIQGLEISRHSSYTNDVAQQHGIFSGDGAAGLVFADIYIHDVSGDGLFLNQLTSIGGLHYTNVFCTNITVLRCRDDGIEFYGVPNGGRVTVVNSYFDTENLSPMFGGHPDGVQTGLSNSCIWVEGNFFHGFNQYVFLEFSGSNVSVFNNLFFSTRTNELDRAFNSSSQTLTDPWVIANNTAVNFLTYGWVNGGFPTAAIVANNILYNCKYASIDGAATNNFDASANLRYDSAGVVWYDENGTVTGTPAARNFGVNMISNNPAFVNLSTTNLALSAGSPAIDTGTNSPQSVFAYDKLRVARPQGARWDIGAFEYVPPASAFIRSIRTGKQTSTGKVVWQ